MSIDLPAVSLDLQAADLLERTADAFESGELSWGRGQLRDEDGNVCAHGGLLTMAGGRLTSPLPYVQRARELTERHLVLLPNLALWNDNVAKNVGDVIELFKHTAKEIRNGQ